MIPSDAGGERGEAGTAANTVRKSVPGEDAKTTGSEPEPGSRRSIMPQSMGMVPPSHHVRARAGWPHDVPVARQAPLPDRKIGRSGTTQHPAPTQWLQRTALGQQHNTTTADAATSV